MTDKLPPQNVEAEESILGGCLLDPGAIERIIDILTPEVFYVSAYQQIYQAMLELYRQNKPTDLLTVTNWLSDHKLLTKVGGRSQLGKLVDRTVSASIVSASVVNVRTITSSFSGSFFGPAPAFAWNAFSVNGTTVTNNMPYNATVARVSVGTYTCGFTRPTTFPVYAISILAASASTNALYLAGPTGSICTPYGLTQNGFTMSFCLATAATTKVDPMSGSIIVNSY